MNKLIPTEYISARCLAEQLGITVRTLFRWKQLRQGPPATKIGRQLFYKLSSLQNWLNQNEGLPPR